MPRASAADAALTAGRILTAATEIFMRDGYAAASTDEIARAAGVTRGAVYHHYGSKGGMLRAAVEAGHARVAARVVDAAALQPDATGELRAGCHAFVDAIVTDAAARLILIDGPAELGWTQWRELDAAASMRELRDAVAAAVSESAPERIDALTHLLSGAMNEGALWLIDRLHDEAAGAALHAELDRLIAAVAG